MQDQRKNQYPTHKTTPKVQDQALGAESSDWHSSSRPTPPPPIGPANQSNAAGTDAISTTQPPLIVTERRGPNFTPAARSRLRMIAYTNLYFRATRWPVWFWTPLSILIAAVISVLKPAIGGENLFRCAIATLSVGSVALAAFVLARFYEFVFCKARSLPRYPRSRMAKISYGTFILSLYLVGLAMIESYAGPQGILAARVPQLVIVQSRIVEKLQGSSDHLNSASRDGWSTTSNSRTPPMRVESVTRPRQSGENERNAIATKSRQDVPNSDAADLSSKHAPAPTATLQLKPVRSWMSESSTTTSGTNAADHQRKLPEPSGGFSALLTPVDLNVTVDSAASIQVGADNSLVNSVESSLSQASEIEAAIGLDGRSTASKLTSHENQPVLFEPGGTFSEPLIVPLGIKIHGGAKATVQPGGAF